MGKQHKSRIRELTQVRAQESLGIPYWRRGAPSGLGRIIYLDRLVNPHPLNTSVQEAWPNWFWLMG